MHSTLALLARRAFLLTWLSSIMENTALTVLMLATSWYVVDALHMKSQLGLILVAGALPRLLLMAFGGVMADRVRKVRIMRDTFWLRAAIATGAALLFWSGAVTIAALVATAVLFGVADAFFWPARDALLPSIVEPDDLPQANSLMQATNWICMTVTPMIAGLLLAWLSFAAIHAVVALLMAAGALAIGAIRSSRDEAPCAQQHVLAELSEGIAYVRGSGVLRTTLLIYAVANLLFMGPASLGPPIIASERLAAGAAGLSTMQSAYGVGMVSGFLAMAVLPMPANRLRLIVAMIVVEGGLLAALGSVRALWTAVGLQFALGLCVACNNVPMVSLIQQSTARDKLGRVMSLVSMGSMGLSPVSFALMSALLSAGAPFDVIMTTSGLAMSAATLAIGLRRPSGRAADVAAKSL